ncbi:MAG: SRPBCC domain-containing protein [Syntrophorhabdaceae bacterium]|nr:SRPBCC domain-containing protein [Syntrophorhabdaceae bacterium]
MIIEGSFTVEAPIEKLFDFMLKPESIMTCVPGTESVRVIDENSYECIVKQKVGIITAKLKFINKMTKVERPTHIEIEGEGEDVTKLGHFKNKTTVDLKDIGSGKVEVTYKSDVSIVGKLAMFGDRIMRAKAKETEKEFTKNLQEKLKSIA